MTLETPRLILRELLPSDAPRLFLLDSNPDVMRYVGQAVLNDVSETEKLIDFIRDQYEKFGIGRLAVIEKDTNLLIGWSGLKFINYEINGITETYDLGYRFLPETWGKGYAYEAGQKSLEYGFEILKLNQITAYCDVQNVASLKVLEKLGFEKGNTFEDQGDQCVWFQINKKDYKK